MKQLVALICGATVLAVPQVAGAKTLAEITGSVSPAITGFPTTPRSVALTVDARFTTDVEGENPATIQKATIYFSHGARVNGSLFPSCSPDKLERAKGSPRACPRGSRLGGGRALGTALGVTEELDVDVYNGPRGRSVLFYLRGTNPVAVSGMINAPLKKIDSRRYAYRLTMPVPDSLQELAPDLFASLNRFTTTVKGTVRVGGRRRGFIEVIACPPGALVPVRGVFAFRGGTSASTDGHLGCR